MLSLVSTQAGVGLCDRDVYMYDLSAGGGGGPSISGCRKSFPSVSHRKITGLISHARTPAKEAPHRRSTGSLILDRFLLIAEGEE